MNSHSRFKTLCVAALIGLAGIAGCEVEQASGPASNYTGPGSNNGGNDTTRKVVVTVTPDSTTVETGETASFVATVTGTNNIGVTWTVTPGGGSITGNGFYTAPASLPSSPMRVVIRATSMDDTTASDSAIVTLKQATIPQTGPCFEEDILPIFVSNCAMSGCHDAKTHEEGYVFTTYQGVLSGVVPGRSSRSEVYEKITETNPEERMPPDPMAPLSAEQIATIKKWIDDGAKNVPCGSGGDCDTTNVTYSGVVRTIFQNNCLGCHNGGDGTNKHVDMSTMTGIKAVIADGRLVKSIEHAAGVTAMPYGGGKLPDCKIAQIKAWINLGAPNN